MKMEHGSKMSREYLHWFDRLIHMHTSVNGVVIGLAFVLIVPFLTFLQELGHNVPKPVFSGPSSFIPQNEVNPVILLTTGTPHYPFFLDDLL